MFKQIYKKLEKEVSGTIALNHVAEIAKHHRIQASPGIRDACKYAVKTLNEYGIKAKIHSYPADGKTLHWTDFKFQEWSCKDAWLKLVEPEKEAKYISRYDEEKIHVIQRSISTPPEGVIAEVVVPKNKGDAPEDYDGIDVKGKIVLGSGSQQKIHEEAVVKRGAIGIITDGMFVRPPNLYEGELDDALKYTSFWWGPDDKTGYGWVLNPRTGRWLRRLIEKSEEPVKVHGLVDAELYEGKLDNAVATIPGETREEVIVIAHICHPQPSANDNASGCGAAMEAARALNKLIASGELPKPKRTIRFTLVPEMAGSYSYLWEREKDIPKMVAAINLDMVGEDQNKTGSTLSVHGTPDSFPSYVNAVLSSIFDETKKETTSIGGGLVTATFRHAVGGYSGGSDHYIYTDPTVGIPCPMVIQWPDKFYHTSADTVDKVSPHSLERVALMTATYAYFLANAGNSEAAWIVSQVMAKEKLDLVSEVQSRIDAAMSLDDPDELGKAVYKLREKIDYDVSRGKEAIASIRRICPKSRALITKMSKELEKIGDHEYKNAVAAVEAYAKGIGAEVKDFTPEQVKLPKGAEKVPERLYRGPISTRAFMKKLSVKELEKLDLFNKKHGITYGGPIAQALYWADGKRNIGEISRLLELETGKDSLEYLAGYFPYLEKMELVKLL